MHQQHDTSVCVSRSVVSKSSRSHSVIPWSGIPWSIVVSDSATPWTVACQAPPSVGFSRQECWSGLPFPSPGDLPDPGIEPGSLHCGQTGRRFTFWATREAQAPLPMEFSRLEYWSGWPFPSLGIYPTQGLNLGLPHCRLILYHLGHQGSPGHFWFNLMGAEIHPPIRKMELGWKSGKSTPKLRFHQWVFHPFIVCPS